MSVRLRCVSELVDCGFCGFGARVLLLCEQLHSARFFIWSRCRNCCCCATIRSGRCITQNCVASSFMCENISVPRELRHTHDSENDHIWMFIYCAFGWQCRRERVVGNVFFSHIRCLPVQLSCSSSFHRTKQLRCPNTAGGLNVKRVR